MARRNRYYKNRKNNRKIYKQQKPAQSIESLFDGMTFNDMMKRDIYIMNFKIGAKTYDKKYLPVEVGIVKCNIKDGVKESFHDFIHPGKAKLGLCRRIFECMEHHGIPFPDFSHENYNKLCEYMYTYKTSRNDENNYETSINEAMKRIDKFVQPEKVLREAGGGKPKEMARPVFTSSVAQTQGCLNAISEATGNSSFAEGFEVLDLAHMAKFARKISKADMPISSYMIEISDEVIGCPYEYLCEFHYDVGNRHCALALASANAYTFLRLMMEGNYHVEVTDKHLDPNKRRVEPPEDEDIVWLPTRFGY